MVYDALGNATVFPRRSLMSRAQSLGSFGRRGPSRGRDTQILRADMSACAADDL